MRPDSRFLRQPKLFWANVRTISEQVGYTVRGTGQIKVPTLREIVASFVGKGLPVEHLRRKGGRITPLGQCLLQYLEYRASILNSFVEPFLMDQQAARVELDRLRRALRPQCPLPMSKQKGSKRTHAFLTGIVNMLIEANLKDQPCDFDPRQLTTVISAAGPLRTMSRRVEARFPVR